MKCFVREAIKELERAGYIVRSRDHDEKGRLREADYVIYEQPHTFLTGRLCAPYKFAKIRPFPPPLVWRGIFCYNYVAIFFQKFQ